jgi:ribosome biogenesis protein MAK21
MPTTQARKDPGASKLAQVGASPLWYQNVTHISASSTALPPVTPAKLSSLVEHGASLHAKAVETFQSKSSSTVTSSSSDYAFLQKILQSGTLSDRLSALTLLVQSSPLHNTKALETLKGMAERGKGKGGREESLKALRCIIDWWVGGGAPNRKLKCVSSFNVLILWINFNAYFCSDTSAISLYRTAVSKMTIFSFGTSKIGLRNTFSQSSKS